MSLISDPGVTHGFHQPPFGTSRAIARYPNGQQLLKATAGLLSLPPSWVSLDNSSSEFARLPCFAAAHMQNSHVLLNHSQKHWKRTLLLWFPYKAYTLSGAGAGNATFAVTSLMIPSLQTNITQFLSSFSKAQVAGLSCTCNSHPAWAIGWGKGKGVLPFLPTSVLGHCLPQAQ